MLNLLKTASVQRTFEIYDNFVIFYVLFSITSTGHTEENLCTQNSWNTCSGTTTCLLRVTVQIFLFVGQHVLFVMCLRLYSQSENYKFWKLRPGHTTDNVSRNLNVVWHQLLRWRTQLQLQSYKVSLFSKLFSEESCSVVGLSEQMSFQLGSELLATNMRWA